MLSEFLTGLALYLSVAVPGADALSENLASLAERYQDHPALLTHFSLQIDQRRPGIRKPLKK